MFFGLIGNGKMVFASGNSTVNINSTNTNYDGYFTANPSDPWANIYHDPTPNATTTGDTAHAVGWTTNTIYTNEWVCYHGVYGFDVSAYQDYEITDISLEFYVTSKQNDEAETQYYAIYTGDVGDAHVDASDGDNWYPSGYRISQNVVDYDDVSTSAWLDFDIQNPETGSMSYVTDDADGKVWFYFMTTNQAQGIAPTWSDLNKTTAITIDAYEGTYKPRLVITYIEDTITRTTQTVTNAPVDTTTDGSEIAESIEWQTPRCAYADEEIYFIIYGDSGADISLELVNSDGDILDTVDDSIRTDGNYDYLVDLPNDTYGFIRLLETTHNLTSTWGYVMPSPDSDQLGNTIFAVSTEYPQYNYDFSRYLTYENDPFVLHFKTNIQSDEHSDHNLILYSNGDSDNNSIIFNQSFEWLNDNYYNSTANQTFMNAWRFIIMTPNIDGSGFEDYDGLIYDLGYNYSSASSGFIQAKILDTTDNSTLANSHSCYWYIPQESDGLIFSLNRSQYTKGEDLNIILQVGSACKATTNLYDLEIKIIDDTGATVETHVESFVEGINEYQYTAPVISGNFEVRFTFSGDCSWSYINDEPFSVKGTLTKTGTESILDNMDNWLDQYGLNTTAGYWMLLLIGMVILFLIAYRDRVMRVALPLLLLGFFMVKQFIDSWLIILLALGAGLALYGIFKRRSGSGSSGDGDG